MKKILIATRNNDKFAIISKLLSSNNFKNSIFYSLNDIEEIIVDKKETGDISQRSFQKAFNAYNNVKNNYDFIVGVDDGIKIKGEIIENVKNYIKPIINDEFLVENEKLFIVRAYTFINKYGKSKTIITEIPFKYKKLKEKIDILENSYPLSYVLSPIGSSKVVTELNEDASNKYYLKFSQVEFNEIENFLNQ